ncbi:hypothetical protein FRC12_023002, partial [Ceratobasidium sp. 428]
MKKSFVTRKAVGAAKKSKKSAQKYLRALIQVCDCKKCFGKARELAKSTVGKHQRIYGRHPDARDLPLVGPSQQRVRTAPAPLRMFKLPHIGIPTGPATLERDDIVVTIGNAAITNRSHKALLSSDFDGPTKNHQVACWILGHLDSRFCVHVGYDGDSLPYPGAGLAAEVFFDGTLVTGTFVPNEKILDRIEQRAQNKPLTTGEMEMTGYEMKDGKTILPFCFSMRPTVETEKFVPSEYFNHVGDIDVFVYWGTKVPYIKPEITSEYDFTSLAEPIDEQLKQFQYRISAGLGEPEINNEAESQRERFDVERVNGTDRLLFT